MIALHELFCADRDALTPICRDDRADGANAIITQAAFHSRTAALACWLRQQTDRRYALCIDDPFDFACALFALFACG